MSLTKDDLKAIKKIVEDAVDDSKRQTAAGFAEVHEKFDILRGELSEVKEIVAHIEDVQQAEIERVDYHDKSITRIRKTLHGV